MIYNFQSAPICSVNIDSLLVNITNASDQEGGVKLKILIKYTLNLHDPCNDLEMMLIVLVFRCERQLRHCRIKNKQLPN